MQSVFGGVEEHRAAAGGGKASQARDARGDGDDHIEREEALAAFRLAADDADGLVGPQVRDKPSVLRQADRELARADDGQHDQRPRAGRGRGRSVGSGAKSSKKSVSSSCVTSRSAPASSNSWACAMSVR